MSTTQLIYDREIDRSYATGWIFDQDAVEQTVAAAGIKTFSEAAPRTFAALADDDAPVFFWEAEQKVLGKILPSWNQGQVGSCVSFGYGRAVQDLMLLEIVGGEPEKWPGQEIATEPIYGGSRVEVGRGRINGDGSVGAWAAKFVKDWGVLLRKRYTVGSASWDLTAYSERLCREWGRTGVPDPLEPVAREHPVTDVAQVKTADELWAALGANKPVPVCSMQGFTTTLQAGFCSPSGQWGHCMTFRGRFLHPSYGKCVVIQNSWGGYLRGDRTFAYKKGGQTLTMELPEGCFCTTLPVAASMLRMNDTFALAGLKGWDADPAPPPEPNPPQPPAPGPTDRVPLVVYLDELTQAGRDRLRKLLGA